jgi:hypothetical protein
MKLHGNLISLSFIIQINLSYPYIKYWLTLDL